MEVTEPLITAPEFAAGLNVSLPTFWRRVADGTCPKPLKIGGLSRWPKSDLFDVVEAAKAAREVAA